MEEFLKHERFSRRIPCEISGGSSCGIFEGKGGVSEEIHAFFKNSWEIF